MALKDSTNIRIRNDVMERVREMARERKCTTRSCMDELLRDALELPVAGASNVVKEKPGRLACPLCGPSPATFTKETLAKHIHSFHPYANADTSTVDDSVMKQPVVIRDGDFIVAEYIDD